MWAPSWPSMKVMQKEVHWGHAHQTSKDSLWGTEVSGVEYESYAKRGALGAHPPNLLRLFIGMVIETVP